MTTLRPRTALLASTNDATLQTCAMVLVTKATPQTCELRAAAQARKPQKSQRKLMISRLIAAGYTHASTKGNRVTPVTL